MVNYNGYMYENYCQRYSKVEDKKEKVSKSIELYKSGLSVYKISDEIGVSRETITKWLHANHISVRGNRKYPTTLMWEIGEKFEGGMTLTNLSEEYGIPYNVLKTKLYEFGFNKNNGRIGLKVYRNGKFIGTYDSLTSFAIYCKCNVGAISRALKKGNTYREYTIIKEKSVNE